MIMETKNMFRPFQKNGTSNFFRYLLHRFVWGTVFGDAACLCFIAQPREFSDHLFFFRGDARKHFFASFFSLDYFTREFLECWCFVAAPIRSSKHFQYIPAPQSQK